MAGPGSKAHIRIDLTFATLATSRWKQQRTAPTAKKGKGDKLSF